MDNDKIIRIVSDQNKIKKVTKKNKPNSQEIKRPANVRIPNFLGKEYKKPTFEKLIKHVISANGPLRLIQLLSIPKLVPELFEKFEAADAVLVQNNPQLRQVVDYYNQLAIEYSLSGSEELAKEALRKVLGKMDEYDDEYFFMIATYCFLLAKKGNLMELEEVQEKFFEISMFPLFHLCYIYALIINGKFEQVDKVLQQYEKEMPELLMPFVNDAFVSTLLDVLEKYMMIVENYSFSNEIKDVLLSINILDELGLEIHIVFFYLEFYFMNFPPSKKLSDAASKLSTKELLNPEALEIKLPQEQYRDFERFLDNFDDDFEDDFDDSTMAELIDNLSVSEIFNMANAMSGFIYDGISKKALTALLENDFYEANDFLKVTEQQVLKIPGVSKRTVQILKKNGVIFKK